MRCFDGRSPLLALALIALSSPVPALAGDNDPIIVTARRVEERLRDVPVSITVFDQKQLADRDIVNAQDLAAYTPSLSVTTMFGAENSTFALRGFVQETGTEPSVGVYFADVVAPRGASQGFPAGDGAGPGAFFDLQNVQVLKGPQGTLFGRNTTGGAILIVPRKPAFHPEAYVEASIGNYDMRRMQAVVNVPVLETLRVRLGVDRMTRGGYTINDSGVGPSRFDDVDYWAWRGSIVADLTPSLETYTILSHTRSRNNGHVLKTIACDSSTAPANFLGLQACGLISRQDAGGFYHLNSDYADPYARLNQWQAINTTSWRVSDSLTVKNIISYAELWTKIRSTLFGTHFFIAPGVSVGFAGIRHIPNGYSSNQRTFTEEFRLEGTADGGKLAWQGGAYYESATPNGFSGSQSPVFIGCSDPDNLICSDFTGKGGVNYTAARNSTRTIGLYAQASYALTGQVELTGGIRQNWDRARSITRQRSYVFPFGVPDASPSAAFCTRLPTASQPGNVLPDCQVDLERHFSAPTWLAGVDYKPVPDVLLYAKYTRGYRTGGIKSDAPAEFAVFAPEKVDAYEVGAKASFRGAVSGSFNIAGFYNDFRNQQLQLGFIQNPASAIAVAPTAGPVNVGRSRIQGIELDSQLQLFEGFTLDGAYTYLDTRVKSVKPVSLPPSSPYLVSGSIFPGDELTLAPRHRFTVTGTYKLPLPERFGNMSASVTYSYSSSQRANYIDRFATALTGGVDIGIMPPLGLVNLNLNWKNVASAPVDLSLFVTNLTGENYYTSVNGILVGTGFETASLGQPRMYGVRLCYRFGD
jgi:iron complex outermembrane receptor protein